MKNFDFKLKIIIGLAFSAFLLICASIWQYNELQIVKNNSARHFNNYLAAQDSITYISGENETLLAQKLSMEFYRSELSKENKKLLERLQIEKNKKPQVVIQTEMKYRDTSIYVPVTSTFDNNSPSLNFNYNPTLKGKNKISIVGHLPYSIYYDTCDAKVDSGGINWSIQPGIVPGKVHLQIEQKIDLVTGLVRDPKTKQLYVRASTDFPGVSFSDLNSIYLLDDVESKKALRSARKPFGLGVTMGLGITAGSNGYIVRGPNLGVGLTYTPKFLQFGK
jgi:hypothetical protein